MNNKTAFSLDKYSFDKVTLDFSQSVSNQLTINFAPSGVFTQRDGVSSFALKFIFTAADKENTVSIVEIECNAIFLFTEAVSFEEIPSYFYLNSIAILFPYIRSFVSTVTLQANHKPILLPTLNLSYLEQDLRNNSTQK